MTIDQARDPFLTLSRCSDHSASGNNERSERERDTHTHVECQKHLLGTRNQISLFQCE